MNSPLVGNLKNEFSRESGKTMYLSLASLLLNYIQAGILKSGQKLPSTRLLASELQINRSTVTKAYWELEQQGWIEPLQGSGHFVAYQTDGRLRPDLACSCPAVPSPSLTFPDLDQLVAPPVMPNTTLHLDDGFPDPACSPLREFYQTYRNQLNRGGYYTKFGCYGDPKGSVAFRERMAVYLNDTRALQSTPENVLSTNGTVMALHLISNAFLLAGDTVVMERPSWTRAEQIFKYAGCLRVGLDVDAHGLDIEQLEEVCRKGPVKMVYITPHHQYPTTVYLSLDRRLKLLDLSYRYGFLIVEDDYDFDYQYDQSPFLPLASMDKSGRVIYCGSFSKNLSPAFRMGYIVAAADIIDRLAKIRLLVDRQGDHIMDNTIADLLEDGTLKRYIRKSLLTYRQRRDVFCELLQTQLSRWITFEKPKGGLAVWTKFAPAIDLPNLSQVCLGQNLAISNGKAHRYVDYSVNGIRLGFASSSESELEKSVLIMKEAIEKQMA
ncbi:aminotransferase-like domain-containing protein [Sphingobacterium haloxyli]|uniref:GntR family transcriptional regulator n=1 Tax=Sphingobacterium haloxyli TaxID=2100533 RepID=A0A2S9IYA4_9SPHI|nr:PLP-dependent aminotransferase family protein [Sphingobacterium haloxyli]PRD45511.1 GntR family transcriptional regulator [Sphingobacterium haloxyli]